MDENILREAGHRLYVTSRLKEMKRYLVFLARCLGIQNIYAVTNESYYAMNHVRLDRKLKTDFAAFWEECEGKPCEKDSRFYVMPVKEYRKDLRELKPSKRAQHCRRFEKLDAIEAAFDENCGKILKNE